MKLLTAVFLIAFIFSTEAKLIKWTGQGGTQLWDFPRNWDCNCIPTAADDVSIDSPFTPAIVRIGGSNATARSLTVGGISPFAMQLYVQGQLVVGPGGGSIASNGQIVLDAAPNQPFITGGAFNAGYNLIFNSGSLAGSGSFAFTYVNLTGPALKVFNTSVSVSGGVEVQPGPGNIGVIDVQGGTLTIARTAEFYTNQGLTLSVYPRANFTVQGAVIFTPSSQQTLTFRGYSNVANLTVSGGNIVVNDASSFSYVNVAQGSTLTLIGAGDTSRNFGSVTGSGTVIVQGGINTFQSLTASTVQLQSGVFSSSGQLNFGNLLATGGSIGGTGQLSVQVASLANTVINNIGVTVGSLTINGFNALNGANLVLTGKGVVSAASQFTMSSGASFTVNSGATLSQSYDFKVLPSGTQQPPSLNNNGQWISTSTLSIVVNVTGSGSWNFGKGGTLSITGINFKASSMILDTSYFVIQVSTVNISSVDASSNGNIDFQGSGFSSPSLKAATYTHEGGDTYFGQATVSNFVVMAGNVNVQSAQVGTLDLRGGTLNGSGPNASVNATLTKLTTNQPKYLNSITITTTKFNLSCPSGDCQLFTQNAVIQTP